MPERRKDRDDVKWTLRSAHTRRSIFQAQEGDDADIQAILNGETQPAAEPVATADSGDPTEAREVIYADDQRKVQGVVETYFASNAFEPGIPVLISQGTSPSDRVELIFFFFSTLGADGPERFEASTQIGAGQNHRLGMSLGAVTPGTPFLFPTDNQLISSNPGTGQFSVRAIDEWIVRDGIVVVLGLAYSDSLEQRRLRISLALDCNRGKARTRWFVRTGGDEGNFRVGRHWRCASCFSDTTRRTVAFIEAAP